MRLDPLYPHALIQDLVVARPFRHAKIGTRLLKVAQRWAQEQRVERLMIEVQNQNYPAIQFVQTHGFTFCGFNDHYFPHHEIAVFFSQSLR
jgi:ribosomal protein S18 acetylase RimI-like enzyme